MLLASLNLTQAQHAFAVVELFTSEGCSSCPPADKVLASMKADAEKNHRPVYFLEYHVDYWNRLGWKDPFSSFQYTLRQKNYTSVLNEEGMYTPMMVINGKKSFTGSDEQQAAASVKSALSETSEVGLTVKIDSSASDTLYLKYSATKSDKNYFIRIAMTESGLSANVGKGENAGKKLSHEAVVRDFFSQAMNSAEGHLKIPLKKFKPGKNCELIAFVQHKQTMHILAVTGIKWQ